MASRLTLLRRHALAHVRTARRLDRLYPSDSALLVALDSEGILAGAIMAAGRLTCEELDNLLGPVTGGKFSPASVQDAATIRMQAYV
jgi:hypothetical protein